MTGWYCRKSAIGWGLERQDGKSSVGFEPNARGLVNAIHHSPGVDGRLLLVQVNEVIRNVLSQTKQRSFGVRNSSKRSELCGRISSALNGAGITPTHRLMMEYDAALDRVADEMRKP